MGLFDLFSNDSAEEAARQKAAGLTAGYNAAAPLYAQGTTDATNLVNQGLSSAAAAQGTGLNNAAAASAAGLAGATSATNQGVAASQANAGLAAAPLQTTFDSATKGANAYGDATGANGTAGLQSAMDTFHNSGQYGNYGFALDQGLQALERTRAAGGALASGGTDAGALNYATGLANNTYNSYVANLQPYLGQQTSAATGLAGVYNNAGNTQAGLYSNLAGANATAGNTLASINGTAGNTLAGINGSLYGNLAGIANSNDVKTGDLANSMQTGIGNADAAATMNNYNVGSNILGAITSAGKLAAGLF